MYLYLYNININAATWCFPGVINYLPFPGFLETLLDFDEKQKLKLKAKKRIPYE